MDEHPFYFSCNGSRIFAILHSPEQRAGGESGKGYIFCAPLGEEQVRTRRIFTTFARELARRGSWVLRFDYRGEGDSDGHFEDASLETRVEDVRAAISELRRRAGVERVGLLGLRLGGTLALLAGAERGEVEDLILWAPIVDIYGYLYSALRANLATQTLVYREIRATRDELLERCRRGEPVNVQGFLFTWALFEQARAIDLSQHAQQYRGRSLVIDLARSTRDVGGDGNRSEARCLYEWLAASGVSDLMSIQREFSWEETPTWNPRPERLFSQTLEWVDACRQPKKVEYGTPRPVSE